MRRRRDEARYLCRQLLRLFLMSSASAMAATAAAARPRLLRPNRNQMSRHRHLQIKKKILSCRVHLKLHHRTRPGPNRPIKTWVGDLCQVANAVEEEEVDGDGDNTLAVNFGDSQGPTIPTPKKLRRNSTELCIAMAEMWKAKENLRESMPVTRYSPVGLGKGEKNS
jgi:hypothetical protein